MRKQIICVVVVLLATFWLASERTANAALLEAELLIVGGGESAVAAAIQAARMGQQRIVLVSDIAWLGGEFSAEAVGAIDEWTVYKGKRTNFPCSGLFLEVLQKVRAYNLQKYGLTNPGNAFCASETIEPAAAAQIFEELIAPYQKQIQIIRHHQPIKVETTNHKIRSVAFEQTDNPKEQLTVRAKLTIDASEWGVLYYQRGRFLTPGFATRQSGEGITVIYETRAGELLFGTTQGRLLTLREGQLSVWAGAPSVKGARVNGLYEDAQGRLWLGCANGLYVRLKLRRARKVG